MTGKMSVGLLLIWIGVVIVMFVGWVMNISTIIGMTFTGNETEVIVRALGIVFAPLGGVMGWL